jgi:SAM-dependent methyltransferase
MSADAMLSVWPVAQQPARVQRRGRYLPASTAHPAKMLPALARAAIERYSEPGELVLDPMCGIGTTLVEAIHLGRRAVGVELEPRWAALAAGNIIVAREQGASAPALAICDDARRLARGLLDDLARSVALVLTSPPYGPSVHGQVRLHSDGVETFDDRYSDDRGNLAHLPQRRRLRSRPRFSDALADILAGCHALLAQDGRVVLTLRPYRRAGSLIDLPGELLRLATATGFELEDRHVALLCGLRGRSLIPRASFFQMQKQRAGVIPRMLLIAHEDVLALRSASCGDRR